MRDGRFPHGSGRNRSAGALLRREMSSSRASSNLQEGRRAPELGILEPEHPILEPETRYEPRTGYSDLRRPNSECGRPKPSRGIGSSGRGIPSPACGIPSRGAEPGIPGVRAPSRAVEPAYEGVKTPIGASEHPAGAFGDGALLTGRLSPCRDTALSTF